MSFKSYLTVLMFEFIKYALFIKLYYKFVYYLDINLRKMSFLNRTNALLKLFQAGNRNILIRDSNRLAPFGKQFYTTNTQQSSQTTSTSTDKQQEHFDEELLKQKILNNALKHVQSLGFTTDAIAQGKTTYSLNVE